MNLANFSFEHIFNNENYQIEPIKTVGTFEPKRWLETFGKSLTRNITEAKILHSNTGLELPLKRYSISKKVGKAVTRNRIRRLIKENLKDIPDLKDGYDIIFIGRIPSSESDYKEIGKSIRYLFRKSGVL